MLFSFCSQGTFTSSVQKDLRIRIVDSKGKEVSGYAFTVKVGDLGTYKDADSYDPDRHRRTASAPLP